MPERSPQTSSPTSPEHLAQTTLFPDQAPGPRHAQANPARATFHQTAAPTGVRTPHAHRSRYKSLPPCRTAPRYVSSSRTRDRKGTSPYIAKRELGRARRSPLRSCGGVRSQSLFLAVLAILRRADEHLHKIVVQRVIKLPLEAPLELRIVQISRMEIEIVRMHWNAVILELDDDLHALVLRACREGQQRMLIQAQLREYAVQSWLSGFAHVRIVKGGWLKYRNPVH